MNESGINKKAHYAMCQACMHAYLIQAYKLLFSVYSTLCMPVNVKIQFT